METHPPHVAVGILIVKGDAILLGKRKAAHGAGEWSAPGGHLEYGESFLDCARREAREEIGCELTNLRFLRVYREVAYLPKDLVNIAVLAEIKPGDTPTAQEPDKCDEWQWFKLDDLPLPLFATIPSMIDSLRTGQTFFDS